MSVTIELLDRLKASQGGISDYACRRIFGVTQQQISKYRSGDSTMSAEKVIQACQLIGIDPGPYLCRMQSERAKCDIERKAWNDLFARLAA